MGQGGMGHGTTVVSGGETITSSAAAAPLARAYGNGIPKVRNAAPIMPGMKSQQSNLKDLGRSILNEAVMSGSTVLRKDCAND